jgi:hypothetical protein
MQYPVGTKVLVDDPKWAGVWIVESNGPKNASLKPVGGGRGLRCPHMMLRPDDGKSPVAVPVVMFALGETVTIGERWPGIYVVIKDDGGVRLNVARLGGDNDKYVRAARSQVKRISVDVKVVS